MHKLIKKLRNLLEYLHPAHIAACIRGDSPDERKHLRTNLRPASKGHRTKQHAIASYAKKHNCHILLETGTFKGDMLMAMRKNFSQLHSIELATQLFSDAQERFSPYSHIHIYQGDSGKTIPQIINSIQEPTLFWLDGHASGGETAKGDSNTPIVAELQAILDHPVNNHVILIDDAREFGTAQDYPTLDEVRTLVSPKYHNLEVKDDIIRITAAP